MLKRPKFKSEVPQKDDKLFKKGDDRQLNAQIDNNNLNFDSYARGYKKAADILVEHIKDEQQDINLLVFSIVFLYRQCIELRLKDIINKGKELFGLSKDIPKHHDINRLWEECREIADKTISYISYGFDRKILNDLIKQFMDVDKISTTFRYPVDKKDNLSFKKPMCINLRNLAEIVEKIDSNLGGISICISDHRYHDEIDGNYA